MAKKPKLCAYCGKDKSAGAMNREHFAGQCLWPGNLPLRMRTVPVHEACNQAAKDDAEYLRDVLVMEACASDHPAVQMHHATIERKMQHHFRSMKETLKGLRLRPVISRGGIYAGREPSFEIDWPRIERALWNVMRGIYCSVTKDPMPQDVFHKIMLVQKANVNTYKPIIEMMVPWQSFGDDVFACRYVFSPTHPGSMTCLMMFYKTRVFIGHSCPRHLVDAP